ncbi:hypothetical protein FIBSPDRAFT_1042955 [Athelia psychrophila]|uniref:Uncharacterized protein n=1 Tax=Athelia psychrophila TaxID=1759441 RepID=A0A166M153_9AGAM|nr:hypothetical protein FIBSPDRAFT_1042955 [Fibularhizoctonia sp. CBS 109695]
MAFNGIDTLGLSEILEDDRSAALTALLISAAHEDKTGHTLRQIYQEISNLGLSHLLDPLDVIPALVPVGNEAARDILALAGECSSAKEVVVAVQESVERVEAMLSAGSDEDDAETDARRSPASQLDVLISLYTASIPRMKLRKKSASDTISPLMTDLEATVRLLSSRTAPDEGRALVDIVCSAVEAIHKWVISLDGTPEDALKCKNILHTVLESTVLACLPFINASLAQQAFAISSPRIASRIPVKPGKEESESAVRSAMRTTQLLGFDVPALSPNADLITLVYLAHSPSVLPFSPSRLETLLPILVTSIMTNVALDETLAILLYQLNGPSDIPLEVLAALANVIPSLASAHPDPSIRMMTFRLLAQLLARAPQQIHLDILRELTSESEFPQMRSAAIGLVREAVLDGLSKPMGQNIFASPQFMKTFAPILFKLNPPNLLAPGLSPEEFIETSEPSRISESLGLLYVLLLRDKHNQTGIRAREAINNIEVDLLAPLRAFLDSQKSGSHEGDSHNHDDMSFASLEMNLERVYSVLPTLQ